MNSHDVTRRSLGRTARGAAPSRWTALALGAALSVALAVGGAAPMAQATAARGSAPAVALPAHSSTGIDTYVTAVYQDLFGRVPDPSGLQTWTTALASGTPRVSVANSITSSAEYRSGLIRGAYNDFLGRPPEPAGMANWLAAMGRGMTIQQMEGGFVASQEYYNQAGATDAGWVKRLYQHVLNREAGAPEVQFWVNELGRGASREAVARGFLVSTERLTTVIAGYYQHLLGRGIDPAGRQSWVTAIQQGARTEAIIGAIVASGEYANAHGWGAPSPAPSPTPTPTPSPTPSATSGSFPSASSTGVPAGVTLTPYTGPMTITQPGTVIDSKLINGSLIIAAGNVTINRSLVAGSIDSSRTGSSVTIVDSEIDGGQSNGAAIGYSNFTMTRVNVHGARISVGCDENCLITDSWLHGQYLLPGSDWHVNGFLSNGGSNMTLRHNTLACEPGDNGRGGGCTGPAATFGDFDRISNVTYDSNLFVAGPGSYCLYGGTDPSKPYGNSTTGVVVVNNVFERGANGKCAYYGPVGSFNAAASGNVWSNNTWNDGTALRP